MPVYVYECPICKEEYLDFQHRYVGTRIVFCECSPMWKKDSVPMHRNYKKEFDSIGVLTDWEPGYNAGIDEHFTSKQDLMEKIKRKGLSPMHNSGSIASSRSGGGLYGDEEYKDVMGYSEPSPDYGEDDTEWVELESGTSPE